MMKVLVVSDTHGNDRNFDRALLEEYPVDMILHLGDVEGSEDYFEEVSPCPIHIVRGNNDFFTSLPTEMVMEIEGYRFFMTHGHQYGVNNGMERLKDIAEEYKCDIVFFGHTHRPVITYDGVYIVNPGSLTYPRQADRKPSYVIVETDAMGELNFTIKYMND